MHPALQVKEIVRMICEHTPTIGDDYDDDGPGMHPHFISRAPSLARLAVVQKGIGDVALDVLWKKIYARALLYLFPLEVVEVNANGKKTSLRPLCNHDWSRFMYYAPKIRGLKSPSRCLIRTKNDIKFDQILDTLSLYRPCLHIIPNLEEIDWWSPTSQETLKLTIFMGARIRHLDLETPQNLYDRPEDLDVLPVVSGLVEKKASVRSLHLRGNLNSHMMPTYTERALSELLQQSQYLTTATLQPTRALMYTLGALKFLKTLDLDMSKAESADTPQTPPTSSEALFPVLETLYISANSLQLVTNLLKGFQCFARGKIEVTSETASTAKEFSSFLEVAIDTEYNGRLTDFCFCHEEDGDLKFPHNEYQITLNDLQGLLACRSLKIFDFTNEFPLALTDEDLKMMVSAWPYITRLKLGLHSFKDAEAFSALAKPHITPIGLAHLSACKRLRVLAVYFAIPDQDHIKSLHLFKSSRSPLETLSVGYSTLDPGCIIPVACFLAEHFPRLYSVYSSLDGPGDDDASGMIMAQYHRWKEVNSGLESLQDMADRLIS